MSLRRTTPVTPALPAPRAARAAALVVAALGLALPSPLARAQDALGDGRALDANLQSGSGGINRPARDFRSEVLLRNAIVTGNAPGGFSFRGEVGYTAAEEFRSALGSDELFEFRRDSFFSTLGTRNIAGLDGLRSTLSFSLAGQSQGVGSGSLIINRSMTGATPEALEPARADDAVGSLAADGFDPFASVEGVLRSPTNYTARAMGRPEVIAVTADPDDPEAAGPAEGGRMFVIGASPLLGVRTMAADSALVDPARWNTIDPSDRPRAADAEIAGTPPTYRRVLERLGAAPERGEVMTERVLNEPAGRPAREIESEPADAEPPEGAAADPPDELPETRFPLEQLNDTDRAAESTPLMRRLRDALLSPLDDPDDADADDDARDEADDDAGTLAPGEDDAEDRFRRLGEELLGLGLPELSDLTPDQINNRLFAEHMQRGQELLAEDRWFLAEERFTAALGLAPGDPMAAAGRVHAQIGAGLFLSAGINLRNMLSAYPELIAVRFGPELLPREDRFGIILAQLRERAARDLEVSYHAGLVMAYLGFQTERPGLIREGLSVLASQREIQGFKPSTLDRLVSATWSAAAGAMSRGSD